MASTTEPKGEPKEVAKEVYSETLSYKTWVLKVSIHCAACSKKVTKILKKIDGVYKTEVDILLQKVTVTGNVEVETLIKKLTQKTAKLVELWPDIQKPNSKDKKQIKPKSKDPAEISEEANHGGSGGGGGGGGGGDMKKEKEKVKVEVDQVQESGGSKKNLEFGSSSNSKNVEDKPHEGGGGGGSGGELKEAKTGYMASQSAPVVAENSRGGESEAVGEKSSGGGKKKKKGHNNVNAAEGEPSADAPPNTESVSVHNGPQPQPHVPNVQSPIQVLPNHGPPAQQHSPLPPQGYQYPYHPRQPQQYYTPPVHAMNYNAAHPSISYGASRYATQPLYSQSHAYAHWGLGGTEVEPPSYHNLENLPPQSSPPPPPYYPPHPYYSSQPPVSDSFTLFSDENPNGCQIM